MFYLFITFLALQKPFPQKKKYVCVRVCVCVCVCVCVYFPQETILQNVSVSTLSLNF